MGLITLEGMEFYAYHGFYREEQIIGNDFVVDVFIETDIESAGYEDNLDKTVNYETIYRIVKMEMQKPSKLLEHIARRIIDRVATIFDVIETITVKIYKRNPPIGGEVKQVSIEMTESFVVQCGKCGRGFISQEPGDCWTKHGQIYPETQRTLMKTHGRNMCRSCLKPYFIQARKD